MGDRDPGAIGGEDLAAGAKHRCRDLKETASAEVGPGYCWALVHCMAFRRPTMSFLDAPGVTCR